MDNKQSKTNSVVRFLALRPLAASSRALDGRANSSFGIKMHRVLIDEKYYKLTSDFTINNECTLISLANNTPNELYEIRQKNQPIGVNVSAIVGENGSGKSTIIDYIIRIINNLSAAIFGEYYYNSNSEHLHYIQDVFAELYVLVDRTVYGIISKGSNLSIYKYTYKNKSNNCEFFEKDSEGFSFNINYIDPCQRDVKKIQELSSFCFTIVVNFSLYSFDTSSYIAELTEDEKELNICRKGIDDSFITKNFEQIKNNAIITSDVKEYINAKSWLPGIFRKYDGYQIPLLITPYRLDGQVDQHKEYSKGKEKLLSLALLRNQMGNRFFTHINNKEMIDKISISLAPEYVNDNFLSIFKEKLKLLLSPTVSLALFNVVRDGIKSKFDIADSDSEFVKVTWYYIVYKFFYILLTYPIFKDYRLSLKCVSTRLNPQIIEKTKEAIDKVCAIHSHTTRLLLRSIFYLKYDLLPKESNKNCQSENSFIRKKTTTDIDIDSYSKMAYEIIKSNSSIHYVDELLPPPIFTIDFKLFNKYDTKKQNVIPFETLSSGEKQITLSLSTIYYYLTQLDSTSDRETNIIELEDIKDDKIICYSHVCVFFDELELYFHPEMQRTFVARFLSGLKQLEFKTIKSIQFIMATHSPFILSDVPKNNVLFLDKDGRPQDVDNMHTFGANIHTMLEHSFFLKDGTMGTYARKIIGEVEAYLKIYKILKHYKESQTIEKEIKDLIDKDGYDFLEVFFDNENDFNSEEFKNTYPKERIKMTIDIFDEPIIKKVLLNDFYEVFPEEKTKERLINTLERQIAELKRTAKSIKENDSLYDTIEQLEIKINDLKNEK